MIVQVLLDDVVVVTPGGAAAMFCCPAATPSVVAAAGGCSPPGGATPTGGCNMGAGKGGTPEVGGNLMPGIIAKCDEDYKQVYCPLTHEEVFLVLLVVASSLEEEFLQP